MSTLSLLPGIPAASSGKHRAYELSWPAPNRVVSAGDEDGDIEEFDDDDFDDEFDDDFEEDFDDEFGDDLDEDGDDDAEESGEGDDFVPGEVEEDE